MTDHEYATPLPDAIADWYACDIARRDQAERERRARVQADLMADLSERRTLTWGPTWPTATNCHSLPDAAKDCQL